MVKKLLAAAAAAALIAALAACGSNDDSTGSVSTATAGSGEKLTIGVTELFPIGFFADFERGLRAATKGKDVELVILNDQGDVGKENQNFQALITRRVDAIIATALNPTGSKAAFKSAEAAGIPVICYNSCLTESDSKAYARQFITSDNVSLGGKTGKAVADYVESELGGNGRALMLTCEQFSPCQDRRKGIDKALRGSGVKLLQTQEAYQVDKATPIARQMLTAHSDANTIIAQNSDATTAAVTAVKTLGLSKKVAVFGVEIDPKIATLFGPSGAGVLRWTTAQDPYTQGIWSLESAVAVASGKHVSPFLRYAPLPTFSIDDPAKAAQYAADAKTQG
ncbi:MAG: sugar transport system substrate-binding protein [Solirubrobacteraceae bacterium]